MSLQFINIDFPFKNSNKGFFINLTETNAEAIKADLMHLLLTNRGERLYLPKFGTNLRKYIFNPNDSKSWSEIKEEIKESVQKYLPNLTINSIDVEQSSTSEYAATVRLDYTITEEVFQTSDTLIIKI